MLRHARIYPSSKLKKYFISRLCDWELRRAATLFFSENLILLVTWQGIWGQKFNVPTRLDFFTTKWKINEIYPSYSVTRCWIIKLPNKYISFCFKSDFFQNSPKSNQIFLAEYLSPRTLKITQSGHTAYLLPNSLSRMKDEVKKDLFFLLLMSRLDKTTV